MLVSQTVGNSVRYASWQGLRQLGLRVGTRKLATASNSGTSRTCLVVGGSGALGHAVVNSFEAAGWTTTSVDFSNNSNSSGGCVTLQAGEAFDTCAARVIRELKQADETTAALQFDAIVHTGGGWAGSDPGQPDFPSSLQYLWDVNVKSAALTAHAAGELLAPEGMLTFTGAAVVADGATPGMCAYGMTKAATHHLMVTCAEMLGARGNSRVHAILPVTIDTPGNRSAMPDADTSSWTSPACIADKIVAWADGACTTPPNGAYVTVRTADNQTTFSF